MSEPAWHRPRTLAEALALRAELGDDALVIAGGTYVGVLLSTGLIEPPRRLHLAARGRGAGTHWSATAKACGWARS